MSKGTSQEELTRTSVARVERMRNQLGKLGSKKDLRLTHPKTLHRLLKVIKD